MSDTVTDPGVEQAEAPDEPSEAPEAPTEEPEPEPEVDDDPDQDEGAEAQAPTGMSIEELEKVRTKLDTSANTWRRRVHDLLGEDADVLVACELCDPTIPGYHWPAELEQPRDDLHAHLLDVLRTPDAPDYLQASFVRRCEACDGWGVVVSGSRMAGKGQVKCLRCKGQGFVGDAELPSIEAPPASNGEVEFPDETQPAITADVDPNGSPRYLPDGQENPNFGKWPQFKDPTLP